MGMVKKDPRLMTKEDAIQATKNLPPVPSLPVTTVNPQPRNEESPVKAAVKRLNENGSDGIVKTRDRSIEVQAILKSTLESPMLAQLTHGKSDEETLKTLKKVFEFAVALYAETK